MADRMMDEEQGGYWSFVLANAEQAEKNKIACIDTANGGILVAGKSAAGLVAIGQFAQNKLGDGAKKVLVRFWTEVTPRWFDNDTVAAIVAADRGKVAYIKDSQTVSIDGTSRSAAGLILDVSTAQGVLVLFGYKTF